MIDLNESTVRRRGVDAVTAYTNREIAQRISTVAVLPDATHPGMWRVRWPDGRLSDMTNLTRAKDAVACFIETEERRQRGRHSPLEGRLCVKTDSWGKGQQQNERRCS